MRNLKALYKMDIFGYILSTLIIGLSIYNLYVIIHQRKAIIKAIKGVDEKEIKKIEDVVVNGSIDYEKFIDYKSKIYGIAREKLKPDESRYLYHNLFEKTEDHQIDYLNELIELSGSTSTTIDNISFPEKKHTSFNK